MKWEYDDTKMIPLTNERVLELLLTEGAVKNIRQELNMWKGAGLCHEESKAVLESVERILDWLEKAKKDV